MALKAETHRSAVSSWDCSCIGTTASRAEVWCGLRWVWICTHFLNSPVIMFHCCGQVSFAKWTKTEKEEDIQLLGSLLRKPSTRIGHKNVLGLKAQRWWPEMPVKLHRQVRADSTFRNVGIGVLGKTSMWKSLCLKTFVCWKFRWRCSQSFTNACLKAVLSPS